MCFVIKIHIYSQVGYKEFFVTSVSEVNLCFMGTAFYNKLLLY